MRDCAAHSDPRTEAVMQKDAQIQASTYARHIAAKVAADLKRLQVMGGADIPSDEEIAAYQEEMSLLLHEGYLGEMTYGFVQDGSWVVALKYSTGKRLANTNDGPPTTENTVKQAFASCLAYSSDWEKLVDVARAKLAKNNLPARTPGTEFGLADGRWQKNSGYASGDLSVQCMVAASRAKA